MAKIIEISEEKHNQFDSVSPHIVQSFVWGKFRKHLGSKVIYLLEVDGERAVNSWLLYITHLPKSGKNLRIGIISECTKPHSRLIEKLREIAKREHLIFIKLEPLIEDTPEHRKHLENLGLVKGRDNFLKNTFLLDITPDEEKLFENFSTSTRRNIRIAQKKNVTVTIHPYKRFDYSALEKFLAIQEETTKRQKFAAHPVSYYFTEYDILQEHMHILLAHYEGRPIAGMILFLFNETAYYPYGASLHEHIDTKSTNLLLFEAIKHARKMGMNTFNFWGALTAEPNPADPLLGVHNFKKGYGGELYEYVGAYDLVINTFGYTVFTTMYTLYWKVVKTLRSKV